MLARLNALERKEDPLSGLIRDLEGSIAKQLADLSHKLEAEPPAQIATLQNTGKKGDVEASKQLVDALY